MNNIIRELGEEMQKIDIIQNKKKVIEEGKNNRKNDNKV